MKFARRIVIMLLAAALLIGAAPFSAFAADSLKYGIGFTTGSNLRLRSQPSTGSAIVDVAPKDEVVVVIGESGDWYHVIYNLQEGYMHKDYVSVLTKENATGVVDMAGSGTALYKGTVEGIAAKEIDRTIFVAGVNNLFRAYPIADI